ncbi:hypothetical protein RJ640_028312 [Escallonia rubra]|uniref:60S acidic ribosomal protein P1 n=1 Tax=Escallonia rubra TaxID=112253 RepID=A0AA88S191_9ASTE|nr:hypothetical protein RJ640_028312 [Escallonia rubra]
MSVGELGCTYASLILQDDGIPITAEKIAALLKAANVAAESYWPSLFAKLAEKRNIEDLITNVGAGGGGAAVAVAAPSAGGGGAPAPAAAAVEEKKEEPKEESDDDMGFSFSFDALSAETIGQKVGTYCFSRAPAVDTTEDKNAAVSDPKGAPSVEVVKKDKGAGSTPPPAGASAVKKPQQNGQGQQRRTPRFAVELDGVHCFETIVPY